MLRTYSKGVIALSACLAGVVPYFLRRGLYEEAKKEALILQDIFGKGNFFLELQDHGIPEQQTVNTGLLRMSKELSIDLVATNDVHYIYDTDAEAHDILLCIQTGKKVADEDRMRYEGGQYYLKSAEEMAELFPYAREAIENTHKIAERCHVEIEFNHYKLPHFEVPEGFTSEGYLRHLCQEGLVHRYGEEAGKYQKRLDYELDTIVTMGFVDYFLIVWDFIKYAKDHGIPVGPGRGSAAGSLVAYSLNITDLIDPIRYNLIFERFLSPGRVTMPDIDVDFCYERRPEVIDYVTKKIRRRSCGTDRYIRYHVSPDGHKRCGKSVRLPVCLCGFGGQGNPDGTGDHHCQSIDHESGAEASLRIRRSGKKIDRYVYASGRAAETYLHSCGGNRDRPAASG